MTSSWKAFGRKLEFITVVLLVLAVEYLWVNSQSGETEAPQIANQAPNEKTQSAGLPHSQPTDVDASQQTTASSPFIDESLPVNLELQEWPLSSTLRTAASDRITLKIATITPESSKRATVFKVAAREIIARTAGRVAFRFYFGGIHGTEMQVHGKINVGELHGGTFQPASFQALCPNLGLYGLFFTFESQEEVDYVRQRLDASLIRCVEEAGFVSFGFAGDGFTRLMSNTPVQNYSDLDNLKVWVPEGDSIAENMTTALTILPVSLPSTDVYPALALDLVDAVIATPDFAVTLYWQTKLKHVTHMPVSYSMSFMAINASAYRRLDPIDQPIVRGVMEEIYADIERANLAEDENALTTLLYSGVEGVQPDSALIATLQDIAAEENLRMANDGYFSIELFDEMLRHLEEYRTASTVADGAP